MTAKDDNVVSMVSSVETSEVSPIETNFDNLVVVKPIEESNLSFGLSDNQRQTIPVLILTKNTVPSLNSSLVNPLKSHSSKTQTTDSTDMNKDSDNVLDKYKTGVNYSFDYLPGVPKQYQCRGCGLLFVDRKKRFYHERNRCLKKIEKEYIYCQHLYCKKRFISEAAFTKHMNRHLGIETKWMSKDVCTQMFTSTAHKCCPFADQTPRVSVPRLQTEVQS